MRGWLGGAVVAARLAAARSELWFPGAMIAFAFAGWVVLLGVLSPPRGVGDAWSAWVQLTASAWWPWNLVALATAAISGALCLVIAIAFGEVAVMAGLDRDAPDSSKLNVPRAMGVLIVVGAPVIVFAAAVGLANATTFVEAYGNPDTHTPYLLRVGGQLWPWPLVLVGAVLIAQVVGALSLRVGWRGVWSASRRRAYRLLPQAAVTSAAFVGAQAISALALATLWQPLGRRLAAGGLLVPTNALLLLGFVWIWLVLVILAGVVQVWISAWWSAELASEASG